MTWGQRFDSLIRPCHTAEALALVRIIVGLYSVVYLCIRAPHLLSYADQSRDLFAPVGIIDLLLPRPLLPVAFQGIVALTLALSLSFLTGLRHRFLAPCFAALLLFVLSYSNSWGKLLHTDNLWVLHVLVLSVAPASEALSFDARHRAAPTEPLSRYGWAIFLMSAMCVLIYLLAGVAKLRNSGLSFVSGDTLRNYIAFGNVRKIELGSTHAPLGVWLLSWPSFFTLLAVFSMALEILSPLALFHRRAGWVWALLVWGFHIGVLLMMAIGFPYQLSAVAFVSFMPLTRMLSWSWIKTLRHTFHPSEGTKA